MLDGAVALAQTAVDAATDPYLNAYLMKTGSSPVMKRGPLALPGEIWHR